MGIYVAYVMYYVDYPRKRSFYVHLKETVYKKLDFFATICAVVSRTTVLVITEYNTRKRCSGRTL